MRWRDAMRPVRDAAALGRNGADALRDATLRFFADAKKSGVPSTADLDKKEAASDLLTLTRAVNGFSETVKNQTTPSRARRWWCSAARAPSPRWTAR